MTDEILQDVWRAKDSLARTFHHDVDALVAALRDRAHASGRPTVDLSASSASEAIQAPARRPQRAKGTRPRQ
jgi:hypothetical protein